VVRHPQSDPANGLQYGAGVGRGPIAQFDVKLVVWRVQHLPNRIPRSQSFHVACADKARNQEQY
jgi:hypothetical protein